MLLDMVTEKTSCFQLLDEFLSCVVCQWTLANIIQRIEQPLHLFALDAFSILLRLDGVMATKFADRWSW